MTIEESLAMGEKYVSLYKKHLTWVKAAARLVTERHSGALFPSFYTLSRLICVCSRVCVCACVYIYIYVYVGI